MIRLIIQISSEDGNTVDTSLKGEIQEPCNETEIESAVVIRTAVSAAIDRVTKACDPGVITTTITRDLPPDTEKE